MAESLKYISKMSYLFHSYPQFIHQGNRDRLTAQ